MPDGSSLRDALDICSELDIEGVELGSNHCHEGNYDYLSVYEFQYLTHNYFPIPEQSLVVNIASLDETLRAASIDHIKKAILFSCSNDCSLYTFHPGFIADPVDKNKDDSSYDFQFGDTEINQDRKNSARKNMYRSIDTIIEFAADKDITIAIETEGSVTNADKLLMQEPAEYREFIKRYASTDIGINLNIGHLNLAAHHFSFDRLEFALDIKDFVVAMELSHNDMQNDDHRPLERDQWYWSLINAPEFSNVPKILEYRNATSGELGQSVALFREMTHVL